MLTTARINIIYIFFRKLAQNAIHSAFSGFTNFTSGMINNQPVLIPVDYIASKGTRTIDTTSDVEYLSMLASTGQPSFQHPLRLINSNLSSPKDINLQGDIKINFADNEHLIRSPSHSVDEFKKNDELENINKENN